ncbi:AAA family ATPase [Nonomuraea sp. NPDC055795]
MGVVLVLMGASGSGKSTLAKALATATGAPVVSYDQHQLTLPGDDGVQAVSAQALASAWRELAACCACGGVVIVDGTHCQRSRRVTVRVTVASRRPTSPASTPRYWPLCPSWRRRDTRPCCSPPRVNDLPVHDVSAATVDRWNSQRCRRRCWSGWAPRPRNWPGHKSRSGRASR